MMDGEAIVSAFAAVPGAECLRECVPKLGLKLKVYNAIKKELQPVTEVCVHFWISCLILTSLISDKNACDIVLYIKCSRCPVLS